MTRLAGILLGLSAGSAALAAGCGWSNPYDTRNDVAAYEAKKRQDLERDALLAYTPPPQEPEVRLAAADLQGWQDTVLAAADDETLKALHAWSGLKIARLEQQMADLGRQDPHSAKVELLATQEALRIEKTRLAMVESRLNSGRPRRAE